MQSLLDLVNSDNKMLSKVVLALASLCREMRFAAKEAEERSDEFRVFCKKVTKTP